MNGVETWQIYGIGGELLAEYAANGSPSNPQKEYGYRNGELLITAEASANPRPNVALPVNGGSITVSSQFASYVAAYLTDGDRSGNGFRVWADSTFYAWPDWAEVTFSGSKTIDEVVVLTRQDTDPGVEPTETTTFTQYGVTAFDVQYWNGSSWVTAPGGSITGNNKVMRRVSFPAVTTTKVRVLVHGGQDNVTSRLVEIEAYEAIRPNFALPVNGGSITVSSQFASYVAAYLTDGDRSGNGFRVWADSTFYVWPDWAEVTFSGSKTIDEVVVVTRQDTDPGVEPTETTTFTQYGVTAFDVQYWNGSSWVTAPGGSITGNNKVMRRVSFPAVTTTKVRVLVHGGQDNVTSRLVEVEAYGPGSGGGSGGSSANVKWLVSDQLGTPRMVFDQTGSLANVSRHDYLPFGEELFAGVGGRTSAQGYTASDNVRQKFTQKERDNETGLDYFGARYFSSTQGRFTGGDPAPIKRKHLINPQDLNRYSYVANNPLAFIDPDGEEKITVIIRTFIPQKQVMTPAGPVKGDNRHVGEKGTYRTEFKLTVETDIRKNGGNIFAGAPERRAGVSEGPKVTAGYIPGIGPVPIPGYGKSEATDLENKMGAAANRPSKDTVQLSATHSVGYPGIPGTPTIDYDLHITIVDNKGKITMTVEAEHDGFPGLEIYGVREGSSNEQLVNSYDPRAAGAGARELRGGPDTPLTPQTRELERDRKRQ